MKNSATQRTKFYRACCTAFWTLIGSASVLLVFACSAVYAVYQQVEGMGYPKLSDLNPDQQQRMGSAALLIALSVCLLAIALALRLRTLKVRTVIEPAMTISNKQFHKVFSPFIPAIVLSSAFLAILVVGLALFLLTSTPLEGIDSYIFLSYGAPSPLGIFLAFIDQLRERAQIDLAYSILAVLVVTVAYIFTGGKDGYCELLDEYESKVTSQQPADTTAQYSREYSTPDKKITPQSKERHMPPHKDLTSEQMTQTFNIMASFAAVLLVTLISSIAASILGVADRYTLGLPASVLAAVLFISCLIALGLVRQLEQVHLKARMSLESFSKATTWVRSLACGIVFSALSFLSSVASRPAEETLALKIVAVLTLAATVIYAAGSSHTEYCRIMDSHHTKNRRRKRSRRRLSR